MGRTGRAIACVALVVLLAGCWPVPGQNADRTGHNAFERGITPATVGGLTEAWTWTFPVDTFPVVNSPVLSPAGVHVVLSWDDNVGFNVCAIVATLDPRTGTERWVEMLVYGVPCTFPANVIGDPFVVGDQVLVGFELLYQTRPCCPVLYEYTAATVSYDTSTGAPESDWVDGMVDSIRGDVATVTTGHLTQPYLVPPVRSGGLDSAGGTTPALSVGGGWIGRTTIGAEHVYVAGSPARAYSLATADNTCGSSGTETCPVWETPLDDGVNGRAVLAGGGEVVYLVTRAGTAYALDGATGAVLWSVPVGAAGSATPALAEGRLFVPTASGDLVVLDAATGATLWSAATGSSIGVQPAVAGGVVFTGSVDGSLNAYDAAGCGSSTCSALWSEATGVRITGAPAVSNGRLYVATADASVIAYGLPA